MELSLIYNTLLGIKGIGPNAVLKKIPATSLQNVDNLESLYELYRTYLMPKSKDIISIEDLKKLYRFAERIHNFNMDNDIKEITYYDSLYPENFREMGKGAHPITPPILIYAKGNFKALSQMGIAIIGTREPSPYGYTIGKHYANRVVEKGCTVISGLAEGCDSAGHTGCLESNGITIAILPTPISRDKIYPKNNTALANNILENNGCLLSEYHEFSTVSRYNFVNRDRLQCGLADGTIVVETGEKGGTMHAVNGTRKLGKPLGCFSYTEDHYSQFAHSRGNKLLLSQGARKLNSIEDINKFIEDCRVTDQMTLM